MLLRHLNSYLLSNLICKITSTSLIWNRILGMKRHSSYFYYYLFCLISNWRFFWINANLLKKYGMLFGKVKGQESSSIAACRFYNRLIIICRWSSFYDSKDTLLGNPYFSIDYQYHGMNLMLINMFEILLWLIIFNMSGF